MCPETAHTPFTGSGSRFNISPLAPRLLQFMASQRSAIFDSTVDEFTNSGLFNKVMGRGIIAFIGFTTDGDVFGGFYTVAVSKEMNGSTIPTSQVLVRVTRSVHDATAVRLKKSNKDGACVSFHKNNRNRVVGFDGSGDCFDLGNEKSDTFCFNLSRGLVGIEDASMTGKQLGTTLQLPPCLNSVGVNERPWRPHHRKMSFEGCSIVSPCVRFLGHSSSTRRSVSVVLKVRKP